MRSVTAAKAAIGTQRLAHEPAVGLPHGVEARCLGVAARYSIALADRVGVLQVERHRRAVMARPSVESHSVAKQALAPARPPWPGPRRRRPASARRRAAPPRRRPDDVEGPDAGRERDVPRRVGVVVAPASRGRRAPRARTSQPCLQPRPRRVGRRRHVVARAGARRRGGTPRACRRRCRRCRARPGWAAGPGGRSRRRCSCCERGLWAMVPGSVAVEVHAVDEQPVVARPAAPAASPASASTAPSATWMCTPTPRSAASPAAAVERVVGARERGVDADQPAAAGAEEALVLGQPAPAVAPSGPAVAASRRRHVGDAVRSDDPHADLGARVGDDRRGCPRWRSGSRGGRRCAVVPHSSASSAPSRADQRSISRSRAASSRHQTCSRISRKSVGVRGGAGMPRASAE